jgi:transcription initiation factor TFIIB
MPTTTRTVAHGPSANTAIGETTRRECPECGGTLRKQNVETACEVCGLVVDEHRIDHGPDWRRTSDHEPNEKRTGSPLTATRHDRGLSTEIGRNRDANGNTLSARKRRQLGRLRREHNRGRFESKAQRNLATGLSEVRRIVSQLDLSSNLRDRACQLLRTAQSEDLLKGRSIERVATACVYAACRCTQTPRTFEDVAEPACIDPDTLQRTYNTLNTALGIPSPPRPPVAFLPRFTSDLDVPDSVRTTARDLATRANEATIAIGCNPSAFAGACLYYAARSHEFQVTQAEVAEVAATCGATIRSHLGRLDTLDETEGGD